MSSLTSFRAPYEHAWGGRRPQKHLRFLANRSAALKQIETMPSNRLSTPVLTVDAARIHEVDTANTQSLHGMWLGMNHYLLFDETRI